MKKILLLLLAVSSWLFVSAQNDFELANTAYAEGRYQEASAMYENLLMEQQNATLYYNNGNAYFKQGELAQAILNYERALRMDPNHKDAKFNLAFAQTKITDNIVEQDFFLSVWAKSIRDLMSENTWTILSILLFISSLAGILGFLLSREPKARKASFHAAWIALLFCVITGLNARSAHQRDTLRDEAIITQGIVNAKSSPDNSGTDLFTLHEGTKVTIRETLSGWVNVKVGQNEGWIPSKDLEKI